MSCTKNIIGSHETEHTKSSNIKLQRRGKFNEKEDRAIDIEDKTRKELDWLWKKY